MFRKLISGFNVYNNPKLIIIFFLGFASGLPFNLIATKATFGYWFAYSGVDLRTIGLVSLIALPYSFKFLWAPFVDVYRVPYLSDKLGNKRAWAWVFQIGLFLSILALGFFNPKDNLNIVLLIGMFVAFFSASQDIVIDALRVKILDDNQQGAGVTVTTVGYRFGMFFASAIALELVPNIGWNNVYLLASVISLCGFVTVYFTPPASDEVVGQQIKQEKKSFFSPFIEFMQRDYWFLFIAFIVLFRLGNSVLAVMAPPFYVDMGFSAEEVARISRGLGFFITLSGGIIGGALVYKVKNIYNALFMIGFLEVLTSVSFIFFANVGYSIPMFVLVTVFDNIVAGIGGVFLVSFLIKLCSAEYTTTQYAFLISLSSLSRDLVSSFSGFVADYLGWVNFFIFDTMLMVPGILLLYWLYKVKPKI